MTVEEQIEQLHKEFEQSMRTTLDKAIKIGDLLFTKKLSLAHGEFMPWVEDLPFSQRTANLYMRVFSHKPELANSQSIANLTEAVDEIKVSKPETPPEPETPPTAPQQVEAKRKLEKENIIDRGGMAVPDHLFDVFKRSGEVSGLRQQLITFKSNVLKAAKEDEELYRYLNLNVFTTEIDNVIRSIKFAVPFAVCRYCSGDGERCTACKGCGFLNKTQWDAVPEDMR